MFGESYEHCGAWNHTVHKKITFRLFRQLFNILYRLRSECQLQSIWGRLQNDWQSQFKNMWNFEYTNYVTLNNCNQFNSAWEKELMANCNHAAYSNELNYLIIFSFQIMQNNIDWNEIGTHRRIEQRMKKKICGTKMKC